MSQSDFRIFFLFALPEISLQKMLFLVAFVLFRPPVFWLEPFITSAAASVKQTAFLKTVKQPAQDLILTF